MLSDEKFTLISKLKYQYIISDPFPEHSQYQNTLNFMKENRSILSQIFGIESDDKNLSRPEDIPIWKAYRMGQEDVYKRLEEFLK